MSLPTTRHGLIKADEGELYDLDVVNNNLDSIDGKLPYMEGPVAITLGAGWVQRLGGFAPVSVYKENGNHVYLRGSMANQNITSWTAGVQYIIVTIPAAYAVPAGKAVEFRVKVRNTIGTPYNVYDGIIICSGTDIRFYPNSTQSSIPADALNLSLDHIHWLTV